MGKSGAKKKKASPSAAAAAAAAAKSPPAAAEHKAPPPAPPVANGAAQHQAPADPGVLLRRAHELKEEGNRLFQSRDYAGALRQYELALRLAPRGHPDRAVFHSNRAACLLQLRPVDHKAVAEECSLALQAEPRFPRALLRRARALEALGRHELALADTLALLALDPNHRDAIDLSHRLRSRISSSSSSASAGSTHEPTSRPSPAALGASAVVAGLGPSLPSRPFPKKQSPPSPPPPQQQPAPAMTKFNSSPAPKLVPFSNSPSSSAEVANVEVAKPDLENGVAEQSILSRKKDCGHAECKEAEIDDWLLQFAELFRNQVGIDADAHLDLHELGMELCSEAIEETVTSEEAQSLFEMAAAKFQEVAALALFNWGNVHMCAARKRIPLDESSPKEIMSAQLRTAYDWVLEMYALAGHRYEEALNIKQDFYEGLLALGQQHFETAKLHWSFALADKVDLSTWDSSETLKLFDSAEEKMRAATEMWEKVEEQRMLELKTPGATEKDEVLKKRKKQHSADGQGELTPEEAAEQAAVMRQQIHLFWGNMLFERSQVEFKLVVGDWKKNLDASVERFKLAGASESDISTVLKNHFSNAVSESEEKKVMPSGTGSSQTSDNIDDESVVES
uniref:Predicted protein n=1 Tax=Hordeum vulgare subsp. vulgare TaxID=112509 RepID=F2D808_HORVV|nr:predicted protein [Hordeum vulgare subsp. vulgare]